MWSAKEYMEKLTGIRSLMDLASNPFLLMLALKALPRLVASNTDLSSIHVTRVGLYDMFVDQWLETNRLRLQSSTLSKEELTVFNSLVDDDFIGYGINYLLRLSAAIFQEQDGNPVVQYIHRHDKYSWKAAFFGSDPEIKLLRDASPLLRTGNQYRFVHRPMLEYFYSRVIYNTVKVGEQDCDSSIETSSPASLICDTAGPLYQRNLLEEPSIIQFLCDRVSHDIVFGQHLRAVIDQSKTDSSVTIAATNAITILVRAGVTFHGADLRDIKIPGADLSYGQFDSAQFQRSRLTSVNFSRSWLRQADLSHAQLEGVQFGELPYLKEKSPVRACAYSPDGKLLGEALWRGCLGIFIYDTSTWQQIHLATATDRARSLAFSPDSGRIASGDEDGVVRLWDCTSGEELLIMEGHTKYIRSLTYSPCGNHIASASNDNTMRLWDSKTGLCVFVLEGHTDRVYSVRFSPDGRQLVSGSDDGTIRFWSSETGEPGVVLLPSLGEICSLAISLDGRWIASGHEDGNVRLWDVVSGRLGPVLQGHTDSVMGMAFSPNGQSVASASIDRRVILWDASTGDFISKFEDHSDTVWDVAFSPNGFTIASGSKDGTVRLWEVNSSRSSIAIQDQIGDAFQMAYSPDGLSLFAFVRPGVIRQGNATTGERGSVLFEFPDPESIYSLVFSLDSEQIAAGFDDGTVQLWDRSTGAAGPVLEGHSSAVRMLAYSTCGRWMASCDKDSIVRLWDLRNSEHQCVLVEGGGDNNDWILDLKFSPTGHQLAVCSEDGIVWLFDPRTRVLLASKKLMRKAILALDYSPDGQQLALGTWTSVALWYMQSEEPHMELKVLSTSSEDVYGHSVTIAFSPCGQFLTSTDADCIVHLWKRQSAERDIDSWIYAFALRACHGFIKSISWNPVVPTEFIIASENGSVRLWRVSSGEGAVAVKMLWGTNIRTLCIADGVLEGATGLSPINRKLLAQRSAFDRGLPLDDNGSDYGSEDEE